MTAKKPNPGKRGRKAVPAEERLEQLTIRLPPKLRLGLDLLSRAHRGRSLSQVIEWAIQRGLNTISVGIYKDPLGDVLDDLWELKSPWQQLQKLYEVAPELLEFIEKSIFETIVNSNEYRVLIDSTEHVPKAARAKAKARVEAALDAFVEKYWTKISAAVQQRDLQGKSTDLVSLTYLVGLDTPVLTVEELEAFLAESPA